LNIISPEKSLLISCNFYSLFPQEQNIILIFFVWNLLWLFRTSCKWYNTGCTLAFSYFHLGLRLDVNFCGCLYWQSAYGLLLNSIRL
jgi:hypothetical protein